MGQKRKLRVCKACNTGLCSECTNWLNHSDWCEHNCAEQPKQLGLFPGTLGHARAMATRPPDPPAA